METTEVTTLVRRIPQSRVDPEAIALAWGKLEAIKRFAREAQRDFEERLLEIVQTHGDVVVGDVRWYAGHESETLCHDVPGVIDAVLAATGGSLDALAGVLRSQPVKHGAAKGILGERWGEFFTVTTKLKLIEGKPVKKLLAVNQRFVDVNR